MRLAVMCTGPFAGPSVSALYAAGHEIVGWFTQPPRGRPDRKAPPNLVEVLARSHGTPIFTPEKINTPEAHAILTELRPDLLMVTDYGQILSAATLATARLGGINLHGSLLPKYRGAAPIQRAVEHGETETGVSVIHMTPQLDAGPCLGQRQLVILPDDTSETLEPKLAELGVELVLETLAHLAAGTAVPIPQDPALASKAAKVRKEEGLLDWSRPAETLRNRIRAFTPWPRCSTHWHRKNGLPLRLIVDWVETVPRETLPPGEAFSIGETFSQGATLPGTVLVARQDAWLVATGTDPLRIVRVQPEGQRVMTAAEFLRGRPVQVGDRLGPG